MTATQIVELIQERFGDRIIAAHPRDKHPRVHVNAGDWRALAEFLHGDPRLKLDWLANLSGVDYAADEQMAVVYDLFSFELKHTFAVKVYAPRQTPEIPSVCDLWPAANWHEREAFDMFGLIFTGHPNLTRILCAEDWEGYPLRKDYVYPREYHGIPATAQMPWDPASKSQPPASTPVQPA